MGFSFSEVMDLSLYQFDLFSDACFKVEGRRRAAQVEDLVNAIRIGLGGEEKDLETYIKKLLE